MGKMVIDNERRHKRVSLKERKGVSEEEERTPGLGRRVYTLDAKGPHPSRNRKAKGNADSSGSALRKANWGLRRPYSEDLA